MIFTLVHNGRKKGQGTKHLVLDGQNQTYCGLSLKKDHVWFAARKGIVSCFNCERAASKKARKGHKIHIVQRYYPYNEYVQQNEGL